MPKGLLQSKVGFLSLLVITLLVSLAAAAGAANAPAQTLLNDGTWTNLYPPSGPDPQEAQAGVHDPVRNRMVVFGGWDGVNSLGTTRALNLGASPAWAPVATAGGPPAGRYAHSMVYDSVRDRMLVFGGRDASPNYFGDVWALSLSGSPTWNQLTPAGVPPSGRFGHEAIYDPVRDRMLVVGGFDGAFRNDLWELTLSGTPTWNQLTPVGPIPPPRDFATSVYDPVADRLVMYGGNVKIGANPPVANSDVWTLQLSGTPTWAFLATGSPPAARILHKSFYDSARNRMVVMGGYDGLNWRNDVYALPLSGIAQWVNLSPLGTPPSPRSDHTMIYDPVNDRGILFGGRDLNGFDNDVWGLALAVPAWTRVHPVPPGAEARLLHKSAYDPARKQMLIFGGYSYENGWLNDTWSIDLNGAPAWTRRDLASVQRPIKRSDHVLIADPPNDRLVMFGGRDLNNFFNDVWTFDLATGQWAPLTPAGVPPSPREAMTGIYDPPRARMLVVCGWNGSNSLNEVWELSLTGPPTWTKLTPAGSPPPERYAHAMIYDAPRDRLIVHGGFNGSFLYNDLWALSLSGAPTWTKLTPGGVGVPALYGQEAIYDPLRDRMVVFAGHNGQFTNWAYALDLAPSTPQWSILSPAGALPKIRDFATSVYDPTLDRLIVFGGNSANDGFPAFGLDDVWALNWSQLPTPTLLSFADEQMTPGAVKLTWFTPDGSGQQATAYRRSDNADWQTLSMLESDASGRFVVEDRIAPGGHYAYRLGIPGASGESFTEEHWVQIPGTVEFGLAGAWPNPSQGRLQVTFRLPDARPAALDLLDVRGRIVLHRDVTSFGPGQHSVDLDRQGDLAPGVYVIRLSQADRAERRKIAIIR